MGVGRGVGYLARVGGLIGGGFLVTLGVVVTVGRAVRGSDVGEGGATAPVTVARMWATPYRKPAPRARTMSKLTRVRR